MTRLERLQRAEALAKAHLARQRDRLAKVQAQQRDAERKALTQRRMVVGHLAESAGLFAWEDATLGALFAQLARLVETPNPVALLEGLLSETTRPALEPVDGSAHAPHGVAPDGASGTRV